MKLTKAERQQAILEIARGHRVSTQGELQKLLRTRGFRVDQATLSRDIREVGLVKVPEDGVHARYSAVAAVAAPAPAPASSAGRLAAVRTTACSGNLVVVKTDPGNANPIGAAIDRLRWPDVVGTVAGDDTLIVVVRDGALARRVARRILELRGA